ncbi:VOC family protein [Polyangium aurulentum]|uniref:VOC family protein n=1 Tax=Polyangium aurulentum TaxID=2567896 RepID=UPI00146D382C|nr:VOC family protein [Polyangium aurulentum]UQA62427.1 VOC family protein [Polyangium aurulentum]
MSTIEAHAPGTFCWIEIAVTDEERGRAFYTSVLDLEATGAPLPNGETYTMLRKEGAPVAGLFKMERVGVPAHWKVYIAVESADETARRAEELGGKIVAPPFDVMEFGRMAVLQDPSGAVFSIWQPGTHGGFGRINEPGAPFWFELTTRDTAAAEKFYGDLFGWTTQVTAQTPHGPYKVFSSGGKFVGALVGALPAWGDAVPLWISCMAVADCDGAVARAVEGGGRAFEGPVDIPGFGKYANVADREGARFQIFTPAPGTKGLGES